MQQYIYGLFLIGYWTVSEADVLALFGKLFVYCFLVVEAHPQGAVLLHFFFPFLLCSRVVDGLTAVCPLRRWLEIIKRLKPTTVYQLIVGRTNIRR